MAAKKFLVIADLRGGRNGADAPMSLPDTQAVECLNVDFYEGTLGRKRNGAASVSLVPSASGTAFSGYLSSLFWGSNGSQADYPFAVDSDFVVNYYDADHNGWARVNGGDAIAASPDAIQTARFKDRLYICYDSGVDRLHYWNFAKSLTSSGDNHTFYRVGLPTPAAPTAADQGGGVQYGNTRWYKITWLTKPGTTIESRSNGSPSVEFDPPTTAGPVRVTKPATPANEDITHWEVYGSVDDDVYHLLSTIDIGTSTYDDPDGPPLYAGDADPVAGSNTPPGSWKYIASDGNRLLGAGNYETGEDARVWFTPVQGASDIGDESRVPTSNFVDLDSYDGDPITGLLGSFMGNVVVFKTRQIWRLVPTGDAVSPYQAVCLTKAIGCVAPKSLVVGEDETGNPALYFLSHRGPYRLGTSGLEYCGRDIEDIISTMNQSAAIVGHAVWHPERHQIWLWVSVGTDTSPSVRLILDTHLCRRGVDGVRGGWAKHTGPSCTARCSMNYGVSISGGTGKINTRPYVGSGATVNVLLRCDEAEVYLDGGVSYQGYVKTKPYALGGLGFNCAVGQPHLTAKAGTNVSLMLTIDRDYGAETRTSEVMLTPIGQETRVQRQYAGAEMAGAGVVQFQIGDAQAANQSWVLDILALPYSQSEER